MNCHFASIHTFAFDVVGIFVGCIWAGQADSRDRRRWRNAEFVAGKDAERVVGPRRQRDVRGEGPRVDIRHHVLPHIRLVRSVILVGGGGDSFQNVLKVIHQGGYSHRDNCSNLRALSMVITRSTNLQGGQAKNTWMM